MINALLVLIVLALVIVAVEIHLLKKNVKHVREVSQIHNEALVFIIDEKKEKDK